MALQINFELGDADLEYFCAVLTRARESYAQTTPQEIIKSSRQLLVQIRKSDAKDFIRERIHQLEMLISMLEDATWHLADDDRERVLTALSYFSNSADLIPDDIPGLGFLDDAIMIEIVCQELKHEIQAYQDFVKDRAAKLETPTKDPTTSKDAEWLEQRRAQLHARMRRRRSDQSGSNKTKSPFSLF